MKKAFLFIAAIFAFNFSHAQGFKFGLKGGVNYSTVTGGEKNTIFGDPDYKTSYHFGVVGLYELDSDGFLGIKPEVLYSSKGYQLNTKFDNELGGTTDLEQKTNINYISVPVLLNINAGPIFFELGPEAAFLTAVTDETKVDKRDKNGNKVDDSKKEFAADKSQFSGFDFGYVAGLGVQLPMGLGIGLRYNGGFISLLDRKNTVNKNVKNSNFMLSLNYMFGGNK